MTMATLVSPTRPASLLDPDSYATARPFAAALRDAASNGIHYPSVRCPPGHCVGPFVPSAIQASNQERHLEYDWDGTRVRRYFDYKEERWIDLS
jgi:hypothetical protein